METEETAARKLSVWVIYVSENGNYGPVYTWVTVVELPTGETVWQAGGDYYIPGYDAFPTERQAVQMVLMRSLREVLDEEATARDKRKQHDFAVRYYERGLRTPSVS